MSVIEKLENYWRGVCDPRYGNSGVNGKFDRTSRRCQSTFNIHSHAHQNQTPLFITKQNSTLHRKLSTPHHQLQQQPPSGTLIINSPCHVCEERSHLKPPSGSMKSNRWKSSPGASQSQNTSIHSHHPRTPNSSNIHPGFPSTNESMTVGHTTNKYTGQPPDFRDRDDILFEGIEDKKSICPNPDPQVNHPSQYESVKMRLQKPEGRPKSLEYSQRRAWMRLYRDMEVTDASSVGSSTSKLATNPVNSSAKEKRGAKPRSKSILHLHRLNSQPDMTPDKMDTLSNASEDSQCSSLKPSQSGSGVSGTSLFQRFSKTFSLRFGSASPSSRKAKKVKYPVGSSPDLYHRVENENGKTESGNSGWKWRQSSLNPDRDEKCLSGDSGISMLQEAELHLRSRSTRRNRRIQSENVDAILEAQVQSSSSSSSSSNIHQMSSPLPHMDSPISRKLSLVEIPDHVWDENNPTSKSEGVLNKKLSVSNNNNTMTKSYEDLLEAKLDDDGFVSDEHEGSCSSNKENSNKENLVSSNHPVHHQSQKSLNVSREVRIQSPRSKSVPRVAKLDFTKDDGNIRGKVISDIIKTEHNYVKTLNDIVQGFLVPSQKRKDLFSNRIISNIFSNVEDILKLQARFLEALISSLNKENLADSSIGHIFTLWTDEFDLYCEYCCNNPVSMLTLQNLTVNTEYGEFFEACRRLQMMDKLPLHGFLLRPIQRICQYHLQLLELLKHTEPDHKDFESTSEALQQFKKVAQKVNDTQRKFDSLKEILTFQTSVDLFEGPHLVDRNSRIIHRGDLIKAHQGRNFGKRFNAVYKEVHVALLNTELVITRKKTDVNRKNDYLFLCRVDLSHRKWHSIDSNIEDEIFGFVHNSWRVYSKEKNQWILFTSPEKEVWLKAMEKVSRSNEERVEPKMKDRVKELMIEQAQQAKILSFQSQNQTQSSYQNNTLPKSKKSSKSKQALISDTILIDAGKRSSFTGNSNSSSQKDHSRTSTFYV